MKSFRFLHCSDLHIDSPFQGLSSVQPSLAEKLRNATYQSFQNIVKLALQEEVEAVLIAGDVYDNVNRSLQAQLKFRRELQKLSEAGIDTFIVHGNHDPLDGLSASLDWPERVHVFSAAQVESLPVARNGTVRAYVYGISYPKRDVEENLAQKFHPDDSEGFSIGLLHANVGHQAGHDNYAPCSIDDLIARNMDYWALGHIHRFKILRKSNPAVVYSGNTQARHMREKGEKGCCLVTLHKNAAPEIRFVSTDVVRFFQDEVDLSGTITIEEVIDAVRSKCAYLVGQVEDKDIFLDLSLNGRTRVHNYLIRDDDLEGLHGEIRSYFPASAHSVWINLNLDTAGVHDIDLHRKGNDFIADLIALFDEMFSILDKGTSSEARAKLIVELKEVLKPISESWPGRRHLDNLSLDNLSNEEIKGILVRVRSLILDCLLRSE